MSTTSSATFSGRYQVLYNKFNLQTWICVITLTKRDITSVQEEDIMEICVWLGYTLSLGVLHFTALESIILFCSANEMRLHSACWMHPPEALHPHHGETQQGVEILMRMTGRSPFLEGEGGIPQDNQSHLLPPHDQMEDGFLRDHLLNPQHLLSLMQMWNAWSIP